MSGFLSFWPFNRILSFRDPNFFQNVHLEWTYSQVTSRVYCSSGVVLRLLVRLEKSLITKGPHWYVWSETRYVSVWTWWGGPREDSSKPRCFGRIFTLWQLWQKPTPTPCPGSWYLTHRDTFLTPKKKRVEIRFVSLVWGTKAPPICFWFTKTYCRGTQNSFSWWTTERKIMRKAVSNGTRDTTVSKRMAARPRHCWVHLITAHHLQAFLLYYEGKHFGGAINKNKNKNDHLSIQQTNTR